METDFLDFHQLQAGQKLCNHLRERFRLGKELAESQFPLSPHQTLANLLHRILNPEIIPLHRRLLTLSLLFLLPQQMGEGQEEKPCSHIAIPD